MKTYYGHMLIPDLTTATGFIENRLHIKNTRAIRIFTSKWAEKCFRNEFKYHCL